MMNQEDIFKKIGQILNELNDQYQYLAQNPRELNELELELFLANANFLSDHVDIIKKINSGAVQRILSGHAETEHDDEQNPSTHEILPAKPILDDIFKLDNEPSNFELILNEKPSTDRFEFEERSADAIFDRPLSKEEELIIAQKQKLREMDSLGIQLSEDDEVGPEPFLVSETAAEVEIEEVEAEHPAEEEEEEEEERTVAETEHVSEPVEQEITPAIEPVAEQSVPVIEHIKEEIEEEPVQEELFAPVQNQTDSEDTKPVAKPTLNDILSGSTNTRNINTESNRVQIKDLKQAISLNDKMRYIKDLFNSYNLAYAEAIDLVNKMPDFKSADEFLQRNYAVKNDWASKQDTVDQFYELLNQRFTVK